MLINNDVQNKNLEVFPSSEYGCSQCRRNWSIIDLVAITQLNGMLIFINFWESSSIPRLFVESNFAGVNQVVNRECIDHFETQSIV